MRGTFTPIGAWLALSIGLLLMAAGCSSDEPADAASASPAPPKPSSAGDRDRALATLAPAGTNNAFSEAGLDQLDSRVRQFVTDGDAGGVSTLLVHKGEVIQYVEAGLQNADTGQKISRDTLFRIYSMTKPIVGVAMMMLYDQGAFSLEDPVAKYVPEFADLKVVAGKREDGSLELVDPSHPPTMRELLSHTAGFSYGFLDSDPLAPIYREKQILGAPNLEEFIKRLATAPLMHQPGAQWNYSVAVDVQGAIIERISGQTLGDFLDENLFEPLGMVDTGFRVPDDQFDRLADVFLTDANSDELIRLAEEQVNGFGVVLREGAPLFESGGFGLASTLPDYARFCQMLANGGSFDGRRYLKSETVDLMRTNVLPTDQPLETPGLLGDNGKPGTGFGLNFGVVYDAEASPTPYGEGSYFWAGLASTWFWIDPANDLYFIGMVQVVPGTKDVADFRRITADILYAAMQ